MSDKIVVVTGAGFSYPAKLPIQNRIIAEMLSKPEIGFMGTWDFETVEFYRAYIEVGIFLIENYTKRMANPFRQKFKAIVEGNARVKAENEFISSMLKKKSGVILNWRNKERNIRTLSELWARICIKF